MNGPEHYRLAEELLHSLRDVQLNDPREPIIIAEAQVHATLAMAAAIGLLDAAQGPLQGYSLARPSRDAVEWDRVTYDNKAGHR